MQNPEIEHIARMAAAIPKQKNLAVFFGKSGNTFIDNVKYFFLHCVQKQPQLQCVYMAFEREDAAQLATSGLPVMWAFSPDAGPVMAMASLVICDDFEWKQHESLCALLENAKVIQLWHGIPLKAIGFPEIRSSVNMTPEKAEKLTKAYSGYEAVVSTSPYFTEHAFAKAFRARHFVECGYPRNDMLQRRPSKYDMINADSDLYAELVKFRKQGGKTLFFMPTFRDIGGDPFADGAIHPGRLAAFCHRHNILFLCKFHPYVEGTGAYVHPNLRLVAPKSDAYPLLSLCDALLTDYSSIYFDFLLLDRPLIFYPYDYEAYTTRNRELLFDYDSMTPGRKAVSEDDLYTALEEVLVQGKDDFSGPRRALRDKAFTHHDGRAAERLGAHIVSNYL